MVDSTSFQGLTISAAIWVPSDEKSRRNLLTGKLDPGQPHSLIFSLSGFILIFGLRAFPEYNHNSSWFYMLYHPPYILLGFSRQPCLAYGTFLSRMYPNTAVVFKPDIIKDHYKSFSLSCFTCPVQYVNEE
jgi:hypothetical protein